MVKKYKTGEKLKEIIHEDFYYKGQLEDENFHGIGIMVKGENFLEGFFYDGHLIYGRVVNEHGTIMEGKMKNDTLNGFGIKKNRKYTAQGEFKNGRPDGRVLYMQYTKLATNSKQYVSSDETSPTKRKCK